MGALWDNCGVALGIWRSVFKKTFIFPSDCNEFINLWGALRITFGQILAYECDLGITLALLLTFEIDVGTTLGSFWGDFRIWGWLSGNFGSTLGLLFAFESDFGGTLASLWGQCWHMRVALGWLWRHSGVNLARFWERLWVYGGDFSSLWDHYGTIVESLWVYEGPFSKPIHFPHKFQLFYKVYAWIVYDFRSL